jgi:CheY-like chemotaxis protein
MVSSVTQSLLGSWGADIRCARNLNDAYSILQTTDSASQQKWLPNHILSDFRLPGEQNGLEVLHLLKAICPSAKCILQTGEPQAYIKEKANNAGVLVLYKPISPEALYRSLL